MLYLLIHMINLRTKLEKSEQITAVLKNSIPESYKKLLTAPTMIPPQLAQNEHAALFNIG